MPFKPPTLPHLVSETTDISRPITSHLNELRLKLVIPFSCSIIIILLLIPVAEEIITKLLGITNIKKENLTTYSPTELLKLKIYLSFVCGLILTLPIWIKSIYTFAKPGLNHRERRGFQIVFSFGYLLFLLGTLIGLFYVTPIIIDFLIVEENLVLTKLSVYKTIRLIISISFFCGTLASLPIISLMTSEYVNQLNDARKYIYTSILIILIIITPEATVVLNLMILLGFATIIETTFLLGGVKNES